MLRGPGWSFCLLSNLTLPRVMTAWVT
jgi:hypothetical protein